MILFLMKLFNIKPKKYWLYHHLECGTKYRGCSLLCPKDNYEKTKKWKWRIDK